ncbi:MAG TPA: hypothetical protein EYH30_09285 [Anaerolineales bacterium]|nr:hypothetical protein [Anaerolineae bacterium]HIQ02300.1 hypothetical protein [Anaerolineales bacterium]
MTWYLDRERIKGLAYAREPHRLQRVAPTRFIFEGHHSRHRLTLAGVGLVCKDCAVYWSTCILPYGGWCRHTIAAERILVANIVEVRLPAFAAQPI